MEDELDFLDKNMSDFVKAFDNFTKINKEMLDRNKGVPFDKDLEILFSSKNKHYMFNSIAEKIASEKGYVLILESYRVFKEISAEEINYKIKKTLFKKYIEGFFVNLGRKVSIKDFKFDDKTFKFIISGITLNNLRIKKEEYEILLKLLQKPVDEENLSINNSYDVSDYEYFIRDRENNYLDLIVNISASDLEENMNVVVEHLQKFIRWSI